MRKVINNINIAMIIVCFFVSLWEMDIAAIIGCGLLFIANINKRCASLFFLLLIFNLHFTLRYIGIKYLQFDFLFDHLKPEMLGYYFLFSCLLYLLIAVAINVSAKYNIEQAAISGRKLGAVGAISILMVSVPIFSGHYAIGREIGDPISRLIVRISLFLQYWLPAIFFLNHWLFYVLLYCAALVFFGSKAFVYMILLLAIYYGLITNAKINYKYLSIFFAGIIISILMFDVILAYRLTGRFDFDLMHIGNMVNVSFVDIIGFYLNKIGGRWGGLDTLAAYGGTDFRFGLMDIYYEAIIGLNNLLPVFKLPIPDNYISSELYTAYLFRGYDFFSVAVGDIRHTDSMFGLPRFIAVDYGFGLIMFLMCLMFPFVIRFKDYFVDTLVKIYFFSSVIIGGSYAETFKLFFELCIIYFLLRLKVVRSLLGDPESKPL